MTRLRQQKNSQEAYNVTICCKVSSDQATLARRHAAAAGKDLGVWLRDVVAQALAGTTPERPA